MGAQAELPRPGPGSVGSTHSAIIIFTLLAPPIAEFALRFGPPEMFALMLMAFTTFVGLGGDDIPKTLFSIFVGLALATIGLDIITGRPRMVFFDIPGFYHGINFLSWRSASTASARCCG